MTVVIEVVITLETTETPGKEMETEDGKEEEEEEEEENGEDEEEE